MKYVINCSEKAAAIIRDSLALAGNVKEFNADDALEALGALDKILPLSELCEAEANKYEGMRVATINPDADKFYEGMIVALRSFGSNS
jgi:hypothetical protein